MIEHQWAVRTARRTYNDSQHSWTRIPGRGPTKHRTGREIAAGKAQINYRDPNLKPNPCGRCGVSSYRTGER